MTNEVVKPGQNVMADSDMVDEITDFLLKSINEWIQEKNLEFRYLDLLMAVHSFHKVIVLDIAKRWERNGIPRQKTFQMADKTFHGAMRDLWRDSMKPSG